MNDDSLLHLLRAPAFVERALRGALAEMIATRRGDGERWEPRRFVRSALVRALRIPASAGDDALVRHERESAVVRAASFFAASALGRRLREMPVERFVTPPPRVDVAVRDRRGALHYVCLETHVGGQARLEAVALAVRAMEPGARASLHFFSLRDGSLRSFPAAAAYAHPRGATARRGVTAA
ncbi:MAG: hypothetical protein NVSMB21_22900 [Vulcanimicrobiaceae bacterium]